MRPTMRPTMRMRTRSSSPPVRRCCPRRPAACGALACWDRLRPDGACAGDLGTHALDRRGIVRRAEDRRARDEGVGARPGDPADVLDLDPAVDLETNVAAGAGD